MYNSYHSTRQYIVMLNVCGDDDIFNVIHCCVITTKVPEILNRDVQKMVLCVHEKYQ